MDGIAQLRQRASARIKTETVQYWRGGVMLTAQMSREVARRLVENGEAFVISSQAIGAIIDGKKSS